MTNVLEPEIASPETFARGLRRYVGDVAAALGVGLESCVIDSNTPASAYIALDTQLPHVPDRDIALLWDERIGWSAAVETRSGEQLVTLAYHGADALPSPTALTAFVAGLVADDATGQAHPPKTDIDRHQATLRKLCDYALPW